MSDGAAALPASDIMFSSNETPARGICSRPTSWAPIINLDDLTHVDFLQRTIGRYPQDRLLPLQSRRCVSRWAEREGFQVMDNPGDAKYGMTRGPDGRGLHAA